MQLKGALNNLPLEAKQAIVLAETIRTLEEVVQYLKAKNFEAVARLCEESPAGDGWGSDNTFIGFTSEFYESLPMNKDTGDTSLDIGDILNYLTRTQKKHDDIVEDFIG